MKKKMKKIKNKKGFTLVELLVAISILGLIMVLAIPSIRNLQDSNRETKYETYTDALITSGKLYTESYSKDMFGNSVSGCVDIPYSLLKNKNLAKDIKVDNTTCSIKNGENADITFVRVYKANNQYRYEVAIRCERNGTVVYEKKLSDTCGKGPDLAGPEIIFEPNGTADWVKTINAENKVTIKIHDDYGFRENIEVKYAWTEDPNSNPPESSYETLEFENKAGIATTTLSKSVDGPSNANGIYYLLVKPVKVKDFNGNTTWITATSGAFRLDNTKPVITSITNSQDPSKNGTGTWTNGSINIDATATDKPDGVNSGVAKIVYAYKTNPTAETYEDWNEGSIPTSVKGTWTAQRNNEVFFIAIDNAGNESDPVSGGYVRIDTTVPTCEIEKSGTTGTNSWYKSNVSLTLKPKDTGGSTLSGYKLTTSATAAYNGTSKTGTQSAETSGTKWYGYVKDAAGNVGKCDSGTIKVDKTKPAKPTLEISGTSTFTVKMTSSDAMSGIAYFDHRKITSTGAYTKFSETEKTTITIKTADTIEIRTVDKAGNISDPAVTKHCNTSGGTLTYHETLKDYVCVIDSWKDKKTETVSGCYTNDPMGCPGCGNTAACKENAGPWTWWCSTGWKGAQCYQSNGKSCKKTVEYYTCGDYEEYSGSGSSLKCYVEAQT